VTLTAADVAEIMRLVEQSTFDELTLEVDGIKLHLRRGGATQSSSPGQAPFAAPSRDTPTQAAGGQSPGLPTHTAAAKSAQAAGSSAASATRTQAANTTRHTQAVGASDITDSSYTQAAAASAPGGTQSHFPNVAAVRAGAGGFGHAQASAFAGAASADPNVQDVTAPLLGTFYRAPKPGAPPFVEVGATVEEDTVVAIIEVMKLMNTVRAGVRGTVTEIPARDGVLVEYGETLLRVRKS
jgi:acetyl-CoA carboxylase biotin carboxyl carrier protein